MSYYWFNRQEVLLKAKERYSKEKSAEYYSQKKCQRIDTKTCQKKKKARLKSTKEKDISH